MIQCNKVIPLPGPVDSHGKAMANTYCMLPMGHEGKCSPEKKEASK